MTLISGFNQRGAIVRIRLRNFMTYTDVVLRPGPNLNMILGPNGTGKSAVVCSIIVGLAGEVSLTGRATSPAGLVKKGSDWASIEIELFNSRGSNYIVTRKIIITARTEIKIDHKSEWKLNGLTVGKTKIQDLTRKLNIKVDNLCQFLPQDSVASFVKMNPSELLNSTLKAAGDNRLVEDHVKLIDLTNSINEMASDLDRLKKACQENEVNARRLESEVERLREREKLQKQKSICTLKVHHLKYVESKANYDINHERLEQINDQFNQVKNNAAPFKLSLDSYRREEEAIKKKIEELNNRSRTLHEQIDLSNNSFEDLKIGCQTHFSRFKTKIQEEKNRERYLNLRRTELESHENRLVEIRSIDLTNDIQKVEQEVERLRQCYLNKDGERSQAHDDLRNIIPRIDQAKARLQQISAIKERKIALLSSRKRDAYLVVEWLSKNRSLFKGNVYAPIMCEINVREPRFAAIIEHAIADSDLFSFVCETEEDLKKLTSFARRDLNARINVILTPDKTLEDFQSEFKPQPYLEGMDFKAYLKALIDAPESIMKYLYGQNRFHEIPVIGECTEAQLKVLLAHCRRFYVGNKFYQVTKSRYDGQLLTVSDSVTEARLLIYSLDTERLAEVRNEIKSLEDTKINFEKSLELLSKELEESKRAWELSKDHLTQLRRKMDERRRLEHTIKRCQEQIQDLLKERIDIEAERVALKKAIGQVNLKMLKNLEDLCKSGDKFSEVKKALGLQMLLDTLNRSNKRLAQKKCEKAEEDAERLHEEIRRHHQKLNAIKDVMEKLKRSAEEKISGFKDGKLDRSTTRKFNEVEQNTVESIEQKIMELTAKVQGICRDASNTLMSEFNRQTQELREKRERISTLESSLELTNAERRGIKDSWLPKLNEVIEDINRHYREFMQGLGYDGQVKLDFDSSSPDNFAVYGIMIMVKYRDNEQLISLSSTRQSGGERSVATMIYMLALQTKTTVPFRCVDEINQGMDKENERKVFELLVKTADESSSQYFLVSPKLLSDLPYSDKMMIHVVFNGRKLDLAWDSLKESSSPD